MEPFEQEYRANVQRSKDRDFARRVWFYGVWMGLGTAAVAALTAAQAAEQGLPPLGQLARVGLELGARMALPAVVLVSFCFVLRAYRRYQDRDVIVTTTERERSYRAPVLPDNATVRTGADWRRIAYIAALVVLGIVYGTVRRGYGDSLGYGGKAIMMVAIVGLGGLILLFKKLYASWRVRRNARLQAQWDRFLDSPDAREVRPREWP